MIDSNIASQEPVSFESRLWCPKRRIYLKQNCTDCTCGYIPSVGTVSPATPTVEVPREIRNLAAALLTDHATMLLDCHTDENGEWGEETTAKELYAVLMKAINGLHAAPASPLLPGRERDAERYRARRYTIYKDRLSIEMPQGKNWRPTTFEDFCAEYDAACDKEIEKQAAEISRLMGEGSAP